MKCYSELSALTTLEERFNYLKRNDNVGKETFGSHRVMNQNFYKKDPRWRSARRAVILRDQGKELGLDMYDISGLVIVHHINPITEQDILEDSPKLFDPENLISCSKRMHSAIHYGDSELLNTYEYCERKPNDTCPWKNK